MFPSSYGCAAPESDGWTPDIKGMIYQSRSVNETGRQGRKPAFSKPAPCGILLFYQIETTPKQETTWKR